VKFPRLGSHFLLTFAVFASISGAIIGLDVRNAITSTHELKLDDDPELRTHCWVLSAQCMQERHAFLSLCGTDGKLHPIEDCTYADDRGHAVLANLSAKLYTERFERNDLVPINIVINGAGVWLLALMLFCVGLPYAAVLCAFFGCRYVIPGPLPGPDVPSAYLGVVCLALVPVIWAAQTNRQQQRPARNRALFVLSYFALGLAHLIRSPIGLFGVLITLVLLARELVPFKASPARKRTILTAAALLTVLAWPPLILAARDSIYGFPADPSHASHGISQTLFHGLGTEPNPFGIRWDDRFGYDYVHQIDPELPYLSDSYYTVLRNAYWSIVFKHPLQVASIYWTKLRKSLSFPFRWGGVSVYIWALVAMVFGFWRWRQGVVADRTAVLAASGVLGFLILFFLQGVAGIPWGKHLYPVKWIVVVAVCCCWDLAIRDALPGVKRWAAQRARRG
jgi:hypothetical protein